MEVGLHLQGEESGTPFAQLLLAVFNSILQVFLLCAAGFILARQGILDKKTQKQLNRLNVSLFTPALLFSKVAFFLTPEKLKELWIIPIFFTIVTTASMFVGRVLGFVFGLRQSQRSFVTAASMFMNSNALPIALMQSLVVSVPDLAWGNDDNKNAMLGRALTYLTMYSTLGMVVRYSYGISLLSRADTIIGLPAPQQPQLEAQTHEESDETTPLLLPSSSSSRADLHTRPSASTIAISASPKSGLSSPSPSARYSRQLVGSPGQLAAPELPHRTESEIDRHGEPPPPLSGPQHLLVRRTTFYNSFPNSPNQSHTNLAQYSDSATSSSSESGSEGEEGEQHAAQHRDVETGDGSVLLPAPTTQPTTLSRPHGHPHGPGHTFLHLLHRLFRRLVRFWIALNNFMTVPLWAAVASLLVACITPLQHALEFHMQPLSEAINTAGKCAVPLTLVVLGAYFYVPPPTAEELDEGRKSVVEDGNTNGVANGNGAVKKAKKPKANRTFFQHLQDILHIPRSQRSSAPKVKKIDPKARPGETKTVVLAVAARMIITPVLLIPLMIMATRFDWHAVFEDPVFVTVNTILLCSPPALTLAQITAAVSGDAFERLISSTIFWSYCVVTPPVTIGCVLLGLWLAKL